MAQYAIMDKAFETQKNMKAGTYTAIVCALLAIFFFFASLTLPTIAPVRVEEGIEVNLGIDETGLGTDQPLLPGDPAPQDDQASTPATPANDTQEDVKGEDNEAEDVPVVKKTETKTEIKKPNDNTEVKKTVVTKPAVIPTPAPPKPKAVFTGKTSPDGKGTGGNGSTDSYYKGGNQGIAGGNGDQGKPGGNPNSDSYTGNGPRGNSGVYVRSGLDGRRIAKLPSFEDDFNENAKVAVDIVVDANGSVTTAVVNPRGTTTTNANVRSIALRKARQLRFNASNSSDQQGTIVFNFQLKG